MKKINSIPALLLAFFFSSAAAQMSSSDNALRYNNRLLREKSGEGDYKMVGSFKVTGSSYLFGEKNMGNLFSPEAKAYNIYLSYNTYNQEIEFYSSANPDKPLVKTPGTVDSFVLNTNDSLGIHVPIKFVYGDQLYTSEKSYYMEIYSGPKYGIYKRYKSDLGYVTSNYAQADLRQFDMLYDYFYVDVQKKKMKKLKASSSVIIREFDDVKDLTPFFSNQELVKDEEMALRKAFVHLND